MSTYDEHKAKRDEEQPRDVYREFIEAQPIDIENIPQEPTAGFEASSAKRAPQPEAGRLPSLYSDRVADVRAMASTPGAYTDPTAQSDIAFLLEIIDAFDQGRL